MKTFKQFLLEKIYDYEVKSFMDKKPDIAKSIIGHVRSAHKAGKSVGFRSDPTPPGSAEITHRSSIWSRDTKTKGLAGQGHVQSGDHAEGVHYTPVHPEHDDHEIIRRALTHKRYRSSYKGATETRNDFHIVTGEHDKKATDELHKRRTQGLHPDDAEIEIKEYPEGMLNTNKISHTIPHKEMWK